MVWKNPMNQHLDKIDNDIAEKHLLKHPFYLAWTRGELSIEALTDYARQYYHHVAAFPTYLSAVHAKCDDQVTRKQLLNNLIDEEAGSPNHPELWLQFAEGLGVSASDVRNTAKESETKKLIETFRSDYARQYYHHVAAFPTYLSAVHAKCDDQVTRKQLLNNLIDEEAGSPNHPELWLQFAEGLGVSASDVRNTAKESETKKLIETFRSVCGD